MPCIIECGDPPPATLDRTVDALDERGFDPRDAASRDHAARWLARLGRNREFLGDLMIDRLAEQHADESADAGYGPQAIMLSKPRGGYFLRANLWPASNDHACRTSGAQAFVYDLPHDHNFDFLTVGYFGPGYISDYYEYDYRAVAGWRGEKAGLRFVERSILSPGRMLHYRAHRDVHRQLPPASLSVSLNIVAADPACGWFDQYAFDLRADCVRRVLNPGSTEAFLRIAVGLGGAEAIDLAERFGRSHPSDRLRLACFEARAGLAASQQAADEIWREAERSGSRLVAAEARLRRAASAPSAGSNADRPAGPSKRADA
ncbi:transposase [Pelagerythrobacter marensis]|uniref:Transposase n=1 Tax=Pelagerythrobacter marensis TaxID=543877 RepID=A0ABZ2D681_9SPHN